jgi:type IX secretion system PorP/SprF family membrane protein
MLITNRGVKYIRYVCLLFGAFFQTITVYSQAKPSYTQYVLNNFILNPAIAGIENYSDIKFSYRNQWTRIQGAPVTAYVTFHTPIGKKDTRTSATSFEMKGVNPRGKDYWAQYSAPPAHHGAGFTLMNDKAGYINRWSIYGTYAYHQPLTTKTTLSAGLNIGLSSVNLDRSQIYFGNLDPNDPAIGYASNELSKVRPEMGAGLWLYSKNYFVGASVLNIIPGKQQYVKNDRYGVYYTPNYFLTAGYRLGLADDFNLLPSFMYQYWQPQLSGLHVNMKLQYRDLCWAGASYRISDYISGYAAMLGLNISNSLNASYSYELSTTSRLRNYTGNTHEIMVGLMFGNKYGDTCPKNVW